MTISRSEVFVESLFVFASIFLLLCLQGLKIAIQAVETLFPELAVLLDKIGGLVQRRRIELAGPPLRLAAARDQAGALQHLEVLGDRGRGHLEWRGELGDRSLARGESRQDRTAGWIGESGEGGAEVIGGHL